MACIRLTMQRTEGNADARGLAACLLLVWLLAPPPPSWAYRPFISTDAAVADPKEVEIELGFLLERDKGENAFLIPRTVINYGLFENWEAVGEFAVRRSPDADLDVIDSALSLKGILKQGVLQDQEAIGIAVELSALLPSTEKGERSFGFEGIGILTGKLAPFIFHVMLDSGSSDRLTIWSGSGA